MARAGDESPKLIDFTPRFQKLNATVYPRSLGRPYKPAEIHRGIQKIGGQVGQNYIGDLLAGRRTNPGFEIAGWICKFYGVETTYFTNPDISEPQGKMSGVAELRDAGVENLAQLAVNLNGANLTVVTDLVRSLLKQQSPDNGGPSDAVDQ